ncbi:hypothetical protein E0H75_01025 [Kribbella capetownensis]|uniref:WD40 repeat domain-containing protein n=1 Tax=Kribbella capetownensis TaxID=1572659 RepID=A0A4R0K3Q9_9ACTN|nr:hypothetical protein [Kribbella capetownensis]TCC52398.1 hypothetical protein E0H75_01025 [Kribbella capetownensis]
MPSWNRSLVAVPAAIAVVAVAGGGLLAAARGPRDQSGAAAAPLSATVAKASAATKTRAATKVAVDATKLPTGRDPQLTYVRGRAVLGGVGRPVRVPGEYEIAAAARLWDTTLTVQITSATSSLLMIQDYTGKVVNEIRSVDSLVTSADGKYVAYASGGQFSDHQSGGTLYFQEHNTGPADVLRQPKLTDVAVLAVVGHEVYFRGGTEPGSAWDLYRWDTEKMSVQKLSKVKSPLSVAADGSLAAGMTIFTDSGQCTAVLDVAGQLQRWRTCQYRLDRFSPGDAFVVGLPPGTGEPYGEKRTAVLDARTGKLLREWTAPSLRAAVAEDDDHLLLQWHDRQEPQSRSALVRCTVSTGDCELATPISPEPLLLGS